MTALLENIFATIDRKDAAGFAAFLHPNCRFRFGNEAEVIGVDAAEAYVAAFFDSIDALSHDLVLSELAGNNLWCHGFVTYTRKDGSTLRVPVANYMHVHDNGKLDEYLIFIDTSKLYA